MMHNLKSPLSSFPKEIAEVASLVKKGAVGVIPTDTLYGIVASATMPDAVACLYKARGRSPEKPCIILISDMSELSLFGISPDETLKKELALIWPNAVSVILGCFDEHLFYLHRGTNTLAFRVPKEEWLREFLIKSGPVVAPSANPEGLRPAKDIKEAESYFGEKVDFYVDAGEREGEPSTLVRYEEGRFVVVRQGAIKV